MTTARDIPEHDAQLAAEWKAHSDETPSSQLDAGILAAAHRAVGSAPEANRPRAYGKLAGDPGDPTPATRRTQRWRVPLAAAATLGAVTLGFLLTRPQQPAVIARTLPVPASAVASAPPAETAAVSRKMAATVSAGAEPVDASAAESPAAAPRVAATRERRDVENFAPTPAAASARAFNTGRASANQAPMEQSEKKASFSEADAAKPFDVEASVARIQKSYGEAKLADAVKELKLLRAAIPDADRRLPPELREWAATVQP